MTTQTSKPYRPWQGETAQWTTTVVDALGRVKTASRFAPDEVIAAVLALIDQETRTDGFISILSHLENCWDERLCAALMDTIKKKRFKTNCLGQLLSELLENDSTDAKRYAEAIVKKKANSDEAQAKRLMAARVLVTHANDSGWKIVWPAIKRDPTFGRQVVEGFAGSVYRRQTSIAERLSEEEMAELFIWLAHEYSYDTDPRHEGAYAVSMAAPWRKHNVVTDGQLWSDGSRHGALCGYPHAPVFRQVLQSHQ